jgi:uncharacterized protein YjiS (DUF1127 family)
MAAISDFFHTQPRQDAKPRRGFFARILDAIVEGQMRVAERRIRSHLATLDDETLKSLGYSREELEPAANRFWRP